MEDEKKELKDKVNRRSFLTNISMFLGLIASYGVGASYFIQFILPKKKETTYRKLLVTSLDKLQKEVKIIFKDLSGRELVLVNTGKGLKAISTTCTHLGCKIYWESENSRFFCPCHYGVFDTDGNVVSGPPPRPLDSYKVEVDENDNVYVMVKET
jgi:cytochrome b6-f complex iron-sulfur subunit